jgi:hypothetical protein
MMMLAVLAQGLGQMELDSFRLDLQDLGGYYAIKSSLLVSSDGGLRILVFCSLLHVLDYA